MTIEEEARSLVRKAAEVMDKIRKLPPTFSPEEVKSSLSTLMSNHMEWEQGDDFTIRKELSRIGNQLDRSMKLKRVGIAAFAEPIAGLLRELVKSLEAVGVFLVPVGELEQWLGSEAISASKKDK